MYKVEEATKFKKKPVVVEAYQWKSKFNDDVVDFSFMVAPESQRKKCPQCGILLIKHGWVKTLEGGHIACPNDWIITGVKGEKYPCKPDIFAQTYEPVEPQPSEGLLSEEELKPLIQRFMKKHKRDWKPIAVHSDTALRLDALKAEGQSYDGVLRDLLRTYESIESQAIKATVKLTFPENQPGG